jgi:hypothetical protein
MSPLTPFIEAQMAQITQFSHTGLIASHTFKAYSGEPKRLLKEISRNGTQPIQNVLFYFIGFYAPKNLYMLELGSHVGIAVSPDRSY